MARLPAMPPMPIVLSQRGVLDYYFWRTIPVVRSWPRKWAGPPGPAQAASIATFSTYMTRATLTAPSLVEAFSDQTANTSWTWRDAMATAAFGNLNTSP